jgi:hypothetical protein
MTDKDRERLAEVMARDHAREESWAEYTYEERNSLLEFYARGIAAAERAGFTWSESAPPHGRGAAQGPGKGF